MDIPFNLKFMVNKKVQKIPHKRLGTLTIKTKTTPLFLIYFLIAGKFMFKGFKEILKVN